MSRDPYDILGVKRDAPQKDIQSAYRKLAKKLHPDLNPGDKQAEDKFKEVSAAYGILGDEEKRARFDRGEIDGNGAEQPPRSYYRDYATSEGQRGPYRNAGGFADFGDTDDILSSFFSRRSRGQSGMQGQDRHYSMEVDFLDSINGAKKQIKLAGRTSTRRADTAGNPRRTDAAPTWQGRSRFWWRCAWGCADRSACAPAPLFRSRWRRHQTGIADFPHGGSARRQDPRAHTLRPGHRHASAELQHRQGLAAEGQGVPVRGKESGDAYVSLKIVLPDAPDSELAAFASGMAGRQDA